MKSHRFKLLSAVVDPMRRVLSTAYHLYPKRLADGEIDLVRIFLLSRLMF